MLNKYYRFAIEMPLSKAIESGYKPDSQLRKKNRNLSGYFPTFLHLEKIIVSFQLGCEQ